MTRRLVVVGGGEHARVVAEAAALAGFEVAGFTDARDPGAGGASPGLGRWLGTDEAFAGSLAGSPRADRPMAVLGFGGTRVARRRAVERYADLVDWASVVHPAAWVAPSATIGAGAVVLARAMVGTGASVGAHAIVNGGAVVEHDVRVGAHAHVGPGAVIGGGAVIGDDALVALGAAVRDHVTVGRGATVGMGAAVVADVADGITVLGVPARAGEGAGR